jgi:major membrane immunogen (membrane-anchored lipoprotein)
MQVDIRKVSEIIQDFHNKRIEIKSKDGFCMWQHKYTSEDTFNKAFREINKKFSEELKRREREVAL